MQNKKYVLRGASGGYFVQGAGFTATSKCGATVLTQAQLDCAAGLGFSGTPEAATTSFAVVYIRKGEGQNLLAGQGKNSPDANKGQVDPSKRRFATFDEAVQHGSRFAERRAKRTDGNGSAGHEGFFVIQTSDEVNAAINWKTGLTNPVAA